MPTAEAGTRRRTASSCRLPAGGLPLDTPGMRELQLWEWATASNRPSTTCVTAAALCRFADCSHGGEPGCGVQAALADGALTHERYDSWRKLQAELQHLAVKQDKRLRSEAKKEFRRRARGRRKVTW